MRVENLTMQENEMAKLRCERICVKWGQNARFHVKFAASVGRPRSCDVPWPTGVLLSSGDIGGSVACESGTMTSREFLRARLTVNVGPSSASSSSSSSCALRFLPLPDV